MTVPLQQAYGACISTLPLCRHFLLSAPRFGNGAFRRGVPMRGVLRRNPAPKAQNSLRRILEAHEGYVAACEDAKFGAKSRIDISICARRAVGGA